MPQPAATQGVAQLNQAEAQGSQQGWGLPHLAESQGLARPTLQAATVPQASEAQVLGRPEQRLFRAGVMSVLTVCLSACLSV